MIILTEPQEKYLPSYMEAFDEYQALGITTYGMTDARACDIFEKYDNYRQERNLRPDRVGADFYWLVDDERDYFIGEITIRHQLNEALCLRGGHIGYVIRCNEWGKGYGTEMLRLALEKAKDLGIERPLITCNDTNIASARVMEKNGFVLGDKVKVDVEGTPVITRRYWKTL